MQIEMTPQCRPSEVGLLFLPVFSTQPGHIAQFAAVDSTNSSPEHREKWLEPQRRTRNIKLGIMDAILLRAIGDILPG